MSSPTPNLSPIANFIRWLMAAVANLVHLLDGAHKAATTPLPMAVQHVPAPATMKVWGQVFDAIADLIIAGTCQIGSAFIAHPWLTAFEAMATIWLIVETVLLSRIASRFAKALIQRYW